LKGKEVCSEAWWRIYGIAKATFYRYKELAKVEKQAKAHGNLESKKPYIHTL